MIDFPNLNPRFVSAIRDGVDIGYIQETNNPAKPGEKMWSGIVDGLVIKADTLCLAKQQVHDIVDDHAAIDITAAWIAALHQHGPMHRTRLQMAVSYGGNNAGNLSARFQLAGSLMMQDKSEMAAVVLSEAVPILEEMLRRLKFAGVERPMVADQAAE